MPSDVEDNPTLHPLQARVLAERLVRRRGPRERQRYAIAQRRGRIDANPHQIDAVVFALDRIPEGGCILADEVGLGKTIEAGLVISQLLTEGVRRVLVIVPKPLLGQWQNELYSLFGLEAREVKGSPESIMGEGVFVVGREWAGSEGGASMLRSAEPFDLCVIDEAHEYFANVYRRFDGEGIYREDSSHSVTAGRVRDLLHATPVMLLTATPMQNTLLELWGLAQYVEPTGRVLGDLPTFRELFCAERTGREVAPERAEELRRRLNEICQRTLRHQAQPFLEVPFVGRHAQTFEYSMTPEEKALYDDVTDYLLDPDSLAFDTKNRTLLLIGFHRRMASSQAALAASLETVAARLETWRDAPDEHAAEALSATLFSDFDDETVDEIMGWATIDDDDEAPDEEVEVQTAPSSRSLDEELQLVRSFAARARALPADSKAKALLQVVDARPYDKLVIFTESVATQEYLRELLIGHGIEDEQVTLFRGTNDSTRARDALDRWNQEVGITMAVHERPSADIAARLALVHEFRTRSQIFISTEAGAKGLNLQFCHTVVNYDLPWNPQRIEQRIGRCHRYGQQRDVAVVNFVASDNEAQKLTFELLAKKLELFGQVLDASDNVLHTPTGDSLPESLVSAIGGDFTKRMQEIWLSARSVNEVNTELRVLREDYEERRREFEESVEKTQHIIQTKLDASIGQVFQHLHGEIPAALRELDESVVRVVSSWLELSGIAHEKTTADGYTEFWLRSADELADLLPANARFAIGDTREADDPVDTLHLDHPLLNEAVRAIRDMVTTPVLIRDEGLPSGTTGSLVLVRITHGGLEPVEHLRLVAILSDGSPVDPTMVEGWMGVPWASAGGGQRLSADEDDVEDAVDDALHDDLRLVDEGAEARFTKLIDQIERYMSDRIVVLRRRRAGLSEKLATAATQVERATGPTARSSATAKKARLESKIEELDEKLRRLIDRDDDEYRSWTQDARARRYERPQVERLFETDFTIVGPDHDPGTLG